jgi:hypothetical protein
MYGAVPSLVAVAPSDCEGGQLHCMASSICVRGGQACGEICRAWQWYSQPLPLPRLLPLCPAAATRRHLRSSASYQPGAVGRPLMTALLLRCWTLPSSKGTGEMRSGCTCTCRQEAASSLAHRTRPPLPPGPFSALTSLHNVAMSPTHTAAATQHLQACHLL